jgi:hypothetical protein
MTDSKTEVEVARVPVRKELVITIDKDKLSKPFTSVGSFFKDLASKSPVKVRVVASPERSEGEDINP